jgi:hypothetical protein
MWCVGTSWWRHGSLETIPMVQERALGPKMERPNRVVLIMSRSTGRRARGGRGLELRIRRWRRHERPPHSNHGFVTADMFEHRFLRVE